MRETFIDMENETFQILEVIKKFPENRGREEIEAILPSLAKRSELLGNLLKEQLIELVKYCRYVTYNKDDVIVKQSTVGDCFYIILAGEASVYIDTTKSDDSEATEPTPNRLLDELEQILIEKGKVKAPNVHSSQTSGRSMLGKFIMTIDSGKSFGEVALLSDNAERNASVVADEDGMIVLVVDKELYNRTVKDKQMEDYNIKRQFISNHPVFKYWTTKFKRLLEISLVIHNYSFDTVVAKQGQSYNGIFFIIKGQAKIVVDPARHRSQYQNTVNDDLNEKKTLLQNNIHIKRKHGYHEAEKRLNHKLVELTYLKEGDSYGELELVLQFPTYYATLKCISPLTTLHINAENLERLITKKNPRTLDLFKETSINKIGDMVQTSVGKSIPLLMIIHEKFRPAETSNEFKQNKAPADKNDRDFLNMQLLQMYVDGKMQLIQPAVADSVYFKFKSAERRKKDLPAREKILREQGKKSLEGKMKTLNEIRRQALSGNGRRVRSRRQLSCVDVGDFKAFSTMPILEHSKSIEHDQEMEVRPFSAPNRIIDELYEPVTSQPDELQIEAEKSYLFDNNQSSSDAKMKQVKAWVDGNHIGQLPNKESGEQKLVKKQSNNNKAQKSVRYKEEYLLQEGLETNKNRLEHEYGSSSLLHLFSVVEAIKSRQAEQNSTVRPKSAPDLLKHNTYEGQGKESIEEGSNAVLEGLESRLRMFQIRLLKENQKVHEKPVVTQLKRFDIQRTEPPVPGGTVLVNMKPCKYRDKSSAEAAEHCHVRRYILPKLRQY